MGKKESFEKIVLFFNFQIRRKTAITLIILILVKPLSGLKSDLVCRKPFFNL